MFDFNRPIHHVTLSHAEMLEIQDALAVADSVRCGNFEYVAAYRASNQPGMAPMPLEPIRGRLVEIAAPVHAEVVREIRVLIDEAEARQADEGV